MPDPVSDPVNERVTVTENGPVATVTLSRPQKRNALDPEMLGAITAAGEALKSRPDIRAVVLTGAGAAFSAGLDTASFPKMMQMVQDAGGIEPRTHGICNLFQYATLVWAELPVPVIAALHGYAFGGAFQIMLGADLRIAAPDTRFSIMEGKWGLVPDMGGMALMRHLARSDVIRRLTYSSEIFSAKQALAWGFVTELAEDPLARATEIACTIATKSPDAIRAAKSLIAQSQHLDVAGALLLESRVQARLIGQPNQMEAVMAAVQGRDPIFKDPA